MCYLPNFDFDSELVTFYGRFSFHFQPGCEFSIVDDVDGENSCKCAGRYFPGYCCCWWRCCGMSVHFNQPKCLGNTVEGMWVEWDWNGMAEPGWKCVVAELKNARTLPRLWLRCHFKLVITGTSPTQAHTSSLSNGHA